MAKIIKTAFIGIGVVAGAIGFFYYLLVMFVAGERFSQWYDSIS